MSDLVSVIMPAFNSSEYIESSIESVLKQTYNNWELIVIDDCSSDDTVQKIEKINDSRIHLIRNTTNKGPANSRNIGIEHSNGEWIAFLDSDDLWSSEKLEKQLRFMKNNNISFSYTNYFQLSVDGKTKKIVSGPKTINSKSMFRCCWIGCLTVMIKKSAFKDIRFPDLFGCEEYALWLKLSRQSDCILLNEVLGTYRKHVGSVSHKSTKEKIRMHYRVFRYSESEPVIAATFDTVRNIIFKIAKQIIFVEKVA